MPAGFKYDLNPMDVEREICRQETIYRLSGGFNLSDATLSEDSYLPHLAPLAVDHKTRKAVAVKNVIAATALTASATSLKVKKGSLAYVGMFLGDGSKGTTVSAINKSNADYDTLTITALGGTAKVGDVLFEASAVSGTTPKNAANFLNYARVKVAPGATITAIGAVYEIQESKLYLPVSAKDKESLGARFMFV